MGKYKLIVFTDPMPGREVEYNKWYSQDHLAHVVAVPGVASAERLQMKTLTFGSFPNRYLAVYDFESDDPDAVVEEIYRRSGTAEMPLSEALDLANYNVAVFESLAGADQA